MTDEHAMTRRRTVDEALDAAAAASSTARRRSRSRATSTPTATRSARCSGCSTCCAPRAASVVASFPTPFVVAPHYRELPGLDLLTPPADFPTEPDVMVTFDCGSLDRLGDLEPAAKARGRADRPRPPRLERPLRHHQRRSIPTRPRAACSCAGWSTRSGCRSPATPRCASTPRSCATPGASSTRHDHAEVFELAASCRRSTSRSRGCRAQLFEEHRFAYLKLLGEALGERRARPRAALRVDGGHPGHARPPRRDARGGRGPHRHRAPHQPRPRSRACSRRSPTARSG